MSTCINESDISFGGPFMPPEITHLCPECNNEVDDYKDTTMFVCRNKDCTLFDLPLTINQIIISTKEFDRWK
jgi:hypothetical protein